MRADTLSIKRKERVDDFVNQMGVVIPVLKQSICLGDVSLKSNKAFKQLSKKLVIDATMKEMKQQIKKGIFPYKIYYPDINTRNKEQVGTAANEILQGMNQLKSQRNLVDSFLVVRVSKITESIPLCIHNIVYGSMIIDNMGEEESWLDFSTSISTTAQNILDETETLDISEEDKTNLMDSLDMYLNYMSALTAINVFEFIHDIDELSRIQIQGNIGGFDEIKKCVHLVLTKELLSIDENTEWIMSAIRAN